jgi:alpha-N-arabinofuranosidase
MAAKFMLRTIGVAVVAIVMFPIALISQEQQGKTVIRIDATHPGAAISPKMFGIFFEDINFGADGGLYPERIKNRSFEFDQPLTGWHAILPISSKGTLDRTKGELDVRTESPLNETNPHYLRMAAYEPGFGLWNTGFRGIGVENGAEYRFSAYVRTAGPRSIRATITDETGRELGSGALTGFDGEWKRYETIIRSNATEAHARFNLFLDEKGSVDLDMVSLFPVDTWNHRPNGLRKDLVQLLADMHPGFIRFPGGCIVEGGAWQRDIAGKQRSATLLSGRRSSTAGTMSSIPDRRLTIFNLSDLASTNTFSLPRISARVRYPS